MLVICIYPNKLQVRSGRYVHETSSFLARARAGASKVYNAHARAHAQGSEKAGRFPFLHAICIRAS